MQRCNKGGINRSDSTTETIEMYDWDMLQERQKKDWLEKYMKQNKTEKGRGEGREKCGKKK